MLDKFKKFLNGSPYRMDSASQEQWADFVQNSLPKLIREWYELDFLDSNIWTMGETYYNAARLKLVGDGGFKRSCGESERALQALKLLSAFCANQTRLAGLGKTTRKGPKPSATVSPAIVASEIPAVSQVEVLEEGEIKEMHVSRHERNAALRRACIEHYKSTHGGKILCSACGMSFGDVYGEIGEGYIEVHHLYPISQTDSAHVVDPKTELVPLCANCHAMIHRLMAAEQKETGAPFEGAVALEKLRGVIEEHK